MTATAATPPARIDADARRARIAANLEAATDDLVAAWRSRDWLVYGLPTWDAYVRSVSPEGVTITLAPALLRERLVGLVNVGLSARAAAPVVGIGKSKAAEILREPEVAERVTSDVMVGNDGRAQTRARKPRQLAPVPAAEPKLLEVTMPDRVVDAIRRHGPGTVHDVAGWIGCAQGTTSCALSRAAKRHRLVETGERRELCAVYDLPS